MQEHRHTSIYQRVYDINPQRQWRYKMNNAPRFGGQRLLYRPRKERYQPENRKRRIIEILCIHIVDQIPTGKILKDYDNGRNDHQNYTADLSRYAAYDVAQARSLGSEEPSQNEVLPPCPYSKGLNELPLNRRSKNIGRPLKGNTDHA